MFCNNKYFKLLFRVRKMEILLCIMTSKALTIYFKLLIMCMLFTIATGNSQRPGFTALFEPNRELCLMLSFIPSFKLPIRISIQYSGGPIFGNEEQKLLLTFTSSEIGMKQYSYSMT